MAADALSYSTPADADAYFNDRLFAEGWFDFDLDNKQRALNDATKSVDSLKFLGLKTVCTQTSEWPRRDIFSENQRLDCTVIPPQILWAQFEIAFAILVDKVDVDAELRQLRITSRGYSSVRATYDPKSIPEHTANMIASARGWAYLYPFLDRTTARDVKIYKV